MSAAPSRGLAHLIGSVPLATSEEVFRRLAGALCPLLSPMPDGETGARRRWVYWQRAMLERHPAMEVDADAGLLELRQWDGSLLRRTDLLRFRTGVDPDSVDFPTGYEALIAWRACQLALLKGGNETQAARDLQVKADVMEAQMLMDLAREARWPIVAEAFDTAGDWAGGTW